MKTLAKNILFCFIISFCYSCNLDKPTVSVVPDKKEMTNGEKSKRRYKAAMKMQGQGNYWEQLSTELNLRQDKLKSIMDLNTKNNEAIKSLREAKPKDLNEQIKEVRMSEKIEVEKILGADLYQQKLNFDDK